MISNLDSSFTALNDFLESRRFSKIYILTDENSHEYCLPIVLGNISSEIQFEILETEPGEEMKNITTATHLWEILTDMKADRNSLLVNLGGGVITDLGGFVASTYKRGISFINIPTTLLGMCDASVGGKTGVDLQHYKNMVGTFANADHIFIYPDFLKTLPLRELKSGFAEMLKHGLAADKNHWEDLIKIENPDAESVKPYISTSVHIKETIVEKDFHEKNIRKTLNLGHTIGHAIESIFLERNTPILHGEAVAAGMICETYLSYLENLISESQCQLVILNINKYFTALDLREIDNDHFFDILLNDKKNSENTIKFSLLSEIGSCLFDQICEEKNIRKSVDFYIKQSGF